MLNQRSHTSFAYITDVDELRRAIKAMEGRLGTLEEHMLHAGITIASMAEGCGISHPPRPIPPPRDVYIDRLKQSVTDLGADVCTLREAIRKHKDDMWDLGGGIDGSGALIDRAGRYLGACAVIDEELWEVIDENDNDEVDLF